MNYETLTQHLAGYTPASIEKAPGGWIDRGLTFENVLGAIGNLCVRLAAVEDVDALALAVCRYASSATNPAEKATAGRASEALAALIGHNEMLNAFAEPIEMMAQASIKAQAKE